MLTDGQRQNVCVVLVGTRNPLNIGAAARAMRNFGFRHLRVVKPYDVAFREARSAVGAAELLRVAEEYKTVAGAVADCTLVIGTTAIGKRQLQQPVRTLDIGAKLIRTQLNSGRVAILFGSEKTGLSNEDLSHCHWLLHVPTRLEHLSMNLAQAVAVALYELVRGAGPRTLKVGPGLAAANELERLTGLLIEVAADVGFLSEPSDHSSAQKLRRLIRRLQVQAADAEILLGLARQILWKLHTRAPGA